MAKQITPGEQSRAAILRGARQHSTDHTWSKGRNVVLDRKYGSPTITKDGVTVARHDQ